MLHRRPSTQRPAKESGAAVILVLALLVLVAVLTLAFLARTRTELVTADIGGRALAARRLAQLAADTIQVQILEATTNEVSPVWASQPGMIRTYNVDGSPSTRYKLFSAASMISSGGTYDPTTEDRIPENWEQAVSEYIDLNAPEGLRYPIADPAAAEDNSVLGFEIGAGETTVPDGTASKLPMPVKWLYVLEDGTQVAPISDGFSQDAQGRPGQKVSIPGASERNPIIGRIAFWADDETSKVNVNTAVGHSFPVEGGITTAGGFNAIPRFAFEDDAKALSERTPVKGEYQRYRGHPANVSLSAVFPQFNDEELACIAPRATTEFTSRGGTVATKLGGQASISKERLYSSVDELAFNAQRENSKVNSSEINKRRFFLTTRSSSPDLTPFGTPKISLVPGDVEGRVTPERKLASFSATLRPRTGATSFRQDPYYFTRTNALDPSIDLGSPEPSNKPNERLFGYLQRMLDTQVPGFVGKPFSDKFGKRNAYQLGLSIYDYIRASHLTGSDFAPNGVIYPTIDDRAPEDTKVAGYGRMEILTEFGIALIPIAEPISRLKAVREGESISTRRFTVREYAAIALWEAFVPGQGYPAYGQDFIIKIEGLSKLGIRVKAGSFVASEQDPSRPLTSNMVALFPPEAEAKMLCQTETTGFADAQRGWGGVLPPSVYLTDPDGKARTLAPPGKELDAKNYPFFGKLVVYFPVNDSEDDDESKKEIPSFEIGAFAPPANGENSLPVEISITYESSDGSGVNLARYKAEIGGVRSLTADTIIPPIAFPESPPQELEERIGNVVGGNEGNPGLWRKLLDSQDVVRTSQMINALGLPKDRGDLRITAPSIFALDPALPRLLPRPDMVIADLTDILDNDLTLLDFRSLHSFTTNTGLIYPVQNPQFDSGSGKTTFRYSPLIGGFSSEYAGVAPPSEYKSDAPLFMTNWSNIIDGALAVNASNSPGDWDNGAGLARPGPYLNFPDEGHHLGGPGSTDAYYDPFTNEGAVRSGAETGSDRFPSAVMFGSLPTGVYAEDGQPSRPWETLLFSPSPASGEEHFSYALENSPEEEVRIPDHALLEFFRAPVVRPYALSFPAASSGKVNLNTAIVPFTYLRRETALHAALESERVTTPSNSKAIFTSYNGQSSGDFLGGSIYSPVDIQLTLDGIRRRFDEGELYRYPSEICDIFLVPQVKEFNSYDENTFNGYWKDIRQTGLVGDNERERPYASLYPKLTTKSNSYVVHVRAQVIRKARSGKVDEFDSEVDSIGGEWRGSFHLERTLPPSEPGIPDYAQELRFPTDQGGAPPSLEKFHRIRIERVERFAPALADEKLRRRSDGGGLRGLL